MTWVLALALATAATYAIRVGSVTGLATRPLPDTIAIRLRHAAIGIMAAVGVAGLPHGGLQGWTPATLAAVAVACVAARRWTNAAVVMLPAVAVYSLVAAVTG